VRQGEMPRALLSRLAEAAGANAVVRSVPPPA